MLPSLLITFRETLEMTLIVGITLAFLRRRDAEYVFHRSVWTGVFAGITVSILLAWGFTVFLGGFAGTKGEVFEGVMMLVAAALLTWMIIWMSRQAKLRQKIERRVERHHERYELFGLFLLVFIGVLREGIETVIFLNAAASAGQGNLFGGMLGIILALLIGFLFFAGSHRLHLKLFFRATSSLLVLFAAGLVAHGVHELQEAGVLAFLTEEAWNMNHIVSDKGTLGEFLKGLFGYNGNPSILEVMGYGTFLLTMGAYFSVSRRMLSLRASSSSPS